MHRTEPSKTNWSCFVKKNTNTFSSWSIRLHIINVCLVSNDVQQQWCFYRQAVRVRSMQHIYINSKSITLPFLHVCVCSVALKRFGSWTLSQSQHSSISGANPSPCDWCWNMSRTDISSARPRVLTVSTSNSNEAVEQQAVLHSQRNCQAPCCCALCFRIQ